MHGFSVPVKPRLRSTAVQHGRISAATLTRTVHNVGPPVAQRDDALRGVGVVPAYIPPPGLGRVGSMAVELDAYAELVVGHIPPW